MLVALTATVLYFAQAAPDAAQAPAAAQAPTPAEAAAAPGKTVSPVTVTPGPKPKAQVEQNTVSCHTESVIGSMFPKKVCGTKAQFDERRRDDQENVREWTRAAPLKSN